jgi:hypothetical protein
MGTDDDELFSEEEKEVGEGVIQEAQASIQVAAAHVGGGIDGASEGEGAAMADPLSLSVLLLAPKHARAPISGRTVVPLSTKMLLRYNSIRHAK